ncbi:MAG: proline dehydrogenase family protein [Actinomycetes bacterium]
MVVRQAVVAASQNGAVETAATATPVLRGLMNRFVAGQEAADAVRVGADLAAVGLHCTIEFLGEQTTDAVTAKAVASSYLRLLEALQEADIADRAELSIKPSALGQHLDLGGEEIAVANLLTICRAADKIGVDVTLDMEDPDSVDATLTTLREVREQYPTTGVSLQSYLRRTEQDCADLAFEGSRVRLCKGAYSASKEVAFTTGQDVDLSFVRCLKVLMAGKGIPLIATHDQRLIEIASAIAVRTGRERGSYEIQLLYGVHREEQLRLAAAGDRVRVYLPYGPKWYPYLMRRIVENPANVRHVVSSLLPSL